MQRFLLSCFGVILTVSATLGQLPVKTYEFKNGHWFNGADFTPGTWYVVNGVLTRKAPSKIDSIIDLENRWVVPPAGDFYSLSVADNPSSANTLKFYIDEGVYYLQIAGNTQKGRKETESQINQGATPDGIYGNGAVTCSLGYPFLEYEGPAAGIKNPTQWGANYDKIKTSRTMHADGYWFVDNETALKAAWDKIEAQKPGFLTICLLDAAQSGGKEGKGLTPDMAKAVVKKAHKKKWRVVAIVETADDLRLGLKIGVDGFANIPGNAWTGEGDVKRYELTEDDLKKLAKKKTPVSPSLAGAQAVRGNATVLDFHKKSIKGLFDNGVNIVIASNDRQRTIRAELSHWFSLNQASSLQILKAICENTPKAIYPKRKIGKLDDGYEANFLVLSDNPLGNILKIRAISFKVKQGRVVK